MILRCLKFFGFLKKKHKCRDTCNFFRNLEKMAKSKKISNFDFWSKFSCFSMFWTILRCLKFFEILKKKHKCLDTCNFFHNFEKKDKSKKFIIFLKKKYQSKKNQNNQLNCHAWWLSIEQTSKKCEKIDINFFFHRHGNFQQTKFLPIGGV